MWVRTGWVRNLLPQVSAKICLMCLLDLLGQQIVQSTADNHYFMHRHVNEVVLPCCVFQALEQYVMPHLRSYWNQLQQVLDDNSQSNALLQEEAYQVYGALLV